MTGSLYRDPADNIALSYCRGRAMEDLDFSLPQRSSIYDPGIALAFFKAAGAVENVAQGQSLFTENEKAGGVLSRGPRMYLPVAGEVAVTAGGKALGTVSRGQIFGEMATLAQMPRSATAVAKTNCQVIAVDE